MITILIVDDHAIVRRGLSLLIQDKLGSPVRFLEAPNGTVGLQQAAQEKVDLVLLDIAMPGQGGMDVLEAFKAGWPTMPVLIVTMHAEAQYGIRALRGGACGYLTKDAAPGELIAAVRKGLEGGTYLTSSLSDLLAAEVAGTRMPP